MYESVRILQRFNRGDAIANEQSEQEKGRKEKKKLALVSNDIWNIKSNGINDENYLMARSMRPKLVMCSTKCKGRVSHVLVYILTESVYTQNNFYKVKFQMIFHTSRMHQCTLFFEWMRCFYFKKYLFIVFCSV